MIAASTGATSRASSGASPPTVRPVANPGLSELLGAARRLGAINLTVARLGREAWRSTVVQEAVAAGRASSPRRAPLRFTPEGHSRWREWSRTRRRERAPDSPGERPGSLRRAGAGALAAQLAAAAVPRWFWPFSLETFPAAPGTLPALQRAREWDGRRSLVLAGATCGSGKTGLGCALLRRELERGQSARFLHVLEFIERLREGQGRGAAQPAARVFRSAVSARLLLLDDLGAERPSDFSDEQLERLVNERAAAALPTIITTNFSEPAEIAARYGAAMASRLGHRVQYEWLQLAGPDLRRSERAAPAPGRQSDDQ